MSERPTVTVRFACGTKWTATGRAAQRLLAIAAKRRRSSPAASTEERGQ